MRYKGRVIAANRRRGIEKGSFHVLLDVADFGGVFLHTVQYKADMFAVQFHKFCFYKLCRVVVPGDTDCSSFGADGFKNKGKDFLYPVPVKVSVLYQIEAGTLYGTSSGVRKGTGVKISDLGDAIANDTKDGMVVINTYDVKDEE